MITLTACGSNARDLEVQRLAQVVETLQGQMVAQDQRIESLSNKMIVLKQSRATPPAAQEQERPNLEVVTLNRKTMLKTLTALMRMRSLLYFDCEELQSLKPCRWLPSSLHPF